MFYGELLFLLYIFINIKNNNKLQKHCIGNEIYYFSDKIGTVSNTKLSSRLHPFFLQLSFSTKINIKTGHDFQYFHL